MSATRKRGVQQYQAPVRIRWLEYRAVLDRIRTRPSRSSPSSRACSMRSSSLPSASRCTRSRASQRSPSALGRDLR